MSSPVRAWIVPCVLALVGLTACDVRAQSVPPDGVLPAGAPTSVPGLPTRLLSVGRDLHGTEEAGPIGPLSVVWTAPRGSALPGSLPFRPTYDIDPVGVSARTGRYAFLDIPVEPGTARCGTVVLSPDGRWLAYWVTDAPNLAARWACPGTVELDVYDTVTGRTRRLPSSHGGGDLRLMWIDDHRLVREVQADDDPAGRARRLEIWDVTELTSVTIDSRDLSMAAPFGDGSMLAIGDHSDDDSVVDQVDGWHLRSELWRVDDRGRRRRLTSLVHSPHGGLAVAPGGASVASVSETTTFRETYEYSRDVGHLVVASTSGGDGATVPGRLWFARVVCWSDPTHVVALSATGDHPGDEQLRTLAAVDVRTGEHRTLVRLDGFSQSSDLSFATDLLAVRPEARPTPAGG